MNRVLVKSEVSDKLSFAFVNTDMVLSHMLIVFAVDDYKSQSILQSSIHEIWARQYASSMRNDLRYSPSDLFETFPFPESTTNLETIGET